MTRYSRILSVYILSTYDRFLISRNFTCQVLGRTAAGSSNIKDLLASELTELDAGEWFYSKNGSPYNSESVRVPLFQDIVEFCNANNLWMNIEIKPAKGVETQTGEVVAQWMQKLCANNPPHLKPLFSSFSFDALMAAKAVAPEIPRGYLVDDLIPDWRQKLEMLDAVSLHILHKSISEYDVRDIHTAGYAVFCFTVNCAKRARELFGWGVDSFCTDLLHDVTAKEFDL